jgi:predicted transcriptional regulator
MNSKQRKQYHKFLKAKYNLLADELELMADKLVSGEPLTKEHIQEIINILRNPDGI